MTSRGKGPSAVYRITMIVARFHYQMTITMICREDEVLEK